MWLVLWLVLCQGLWLGRYPVPPLAPFQGPQQAGLVALVLVLFQVDYWVRPRVLHPGCMAALCVAGGGLGVS
jgi:hypothetical protein